MSPETAAWLANVRAWAADPRALIFPVNGEKRSIALFPADVIGKTDAELGAFIERRLTEQHQDP